MRGLKHSLIWTILAAGLLLTSFSLWHVYAIQRQNGWLHQLQTGKDIDIELVMTAAPEIRLARVAYLHDKRRFSEALDTLRIAGDY